MHFGPEDEQFRASAAQAAKEASASGGFGGRRAGAFSASEAHRINQQAFAAAGLSETQHYRRFAEQYRATIRANERGWPKTVAALSVLLFGIYHFSKKIQER